MYVFHIHTWETAELGYEVGLVELQKPRRCHPWHPKANLFHVALDWDAGELFLQNSGTQRNWFDSSPT